jgi:hypothetical protein
MSIKTRIESLESHITPKLARPILCIGPDGATAEQQAQMDKAEAEGQPLKVIHLVRAEAKTI